MKNRNLNLVDRVLEPTPKWFRIVRNLGLALSAVGGVLVAAAAGVELMELGTWDIEAARRANAAARKGA